MAILELENISKRFGAIQAVTEVSLALEAGQAVGMIGDNRSGKSTLVKVIAAAVIGGANLAGGVGTAFGALIGSALIEVIRNSLGLLGVNAFWQGTFVGAFIILAVSFDSIRSFRQAE